MNKDLLLLLVTAGVVLGVGMVLTRRQAGAAAPVSPIPTAPSSDRLFTQAMGLDLIGRFGDTGTPDADTDVYGAPLNARDRR